MESAHSLNCPSCGAGVASDWPNCRHCGVRLATMACPSCFGMMFLGSKFCPHCSSPAVAWQPDPAETKCPHCTGAMFHGPVGGLTVHECGSCFGLWLDRNAFDLVCRDHARQASVLADRPGETVTAVWDGGPIRYRKCLVCAQLMNRTNYAQCSGVIIDVCAAHGVWFDRDELQRIVAFIQSGGLDRSRRREIERLAQERSRLESARSVDSYGSSNAYGHGSWVEPEGLGFIIEAGAAILGQLLD
jgi:Zn-finger nucleic acid-binding protein